MINFNKEIEIKLKVDENILSKLRKIEMESYEELDEYFFSSKEMIEKRMFLRFRSKKGKIFLEFKVLTKGGKDVDVYESDEIETEITAEQYGNMKRIFSIVFPIQIQVKKFRSKADYNDCELCFDKVEELGDFLEIEGPNDKIFEICKNFNIDVDKQRDRGEGYAIMMLKKMGLYD